MARYTQIQTTYDPSLYNEGIILKVDGSIETKSVNEDGTPAATQTLSQPGKGTITITSGGSVLGTFNVDQDNNQTIDVPSTGGGTVVTRTPKYELFQASGSTASGTLSNTPFGDVLFIPVLQDGTVQLSLVTKTVTGTDFTIDTGGAQLKEIGVYYLY